MMRSWRNTIRRRKRPRSRLVTQRFKQREERGLNSMHELVIRYISSTSVIRKDADFGGSGQSNCGIRSTIREDGRFGYKDRSGTCNHSNGSFLWRQGFGQEAG